MFSELFNMHNFILPRLHCHPQQTTTTIYGSGVDLTFREIALSIPDKFPQTQLTMGKKKAKNGWKWSFNANSNIVNARV